jgi:hypothetical protein
MRGLIAGAAAAVVMAAGANAQPVHKSEHREEGMVCLYTNGAMAPSTCRVGDSWGDADLCTCREGTRFAAPVCGPNEKPPAESVALNRARRDAMRAGSLYGASFEGRPMCVVVHHPRHY